MSARAAIVSLLVVVSLSAQNNTVARIDEIFKEWDKPDSPGMSVAAIRDGELVVSKGYGSANLEYNIPITSETIFHVASVSKQFTAMALVLLEQQGKLSIDDDIRTLLPELPDYGHKITIRHLLQHTSGIRDQWQTLALAGWRLDDVITQKQILNVLFRQKELNFPPDTEHLYSNGGYTLAAEIVARVSGKPFPIFCQDNIFKPLGMTRTHFHDDHRRVVPNRAYSYGRSDQGYQASPLNYANAGATSLFTTAPDLAKWLDNFREPKVGGTSAIARLQEPAVLADGKKIEYALGVSVARFRGLKAVSHGGADAGYRSHVVYLPDAKLGVVVLGNAGFINPSRCANQVAEVFLSGKLNGEPSRPNTADHKSAKTQPFDPKELGDYAGAWWSSELETQYTVRIKDAALVAEHVRHGEIRLRPVSRDNYAGSEWFFSQVRFERDSSGRPATMIVGGGRVRGVKFIRR